MKRKYYFIAFFIVLVFFYASTLQVQAYGVGWCHSFSGLNNSNVKYVYPGGEQAWAQVEPKEGQYNFSGLDSMIQRARQAGKKLHFTIGVSNPDVDNNDGVLIPQWAIDKGMHVVYSEKKKLPASPIQWDPIYLDLHEKLLKAFAEKYEKPEYYDVLEAVVMQSGGNWGEMALPAKNGAETGEKADALDPNNLFVKEMARVFLGSEERSNEIARMEGNQWVFDNYYITAVKNIIDIYARSLSHYPFAIQLGFGLTGQRRVSTEPVEYGLSKYGSHMWIRYAWWGSFDMGDSNPNAQDYWGRYQDKTVMVAEVGHPSYWCAAEGGYQKGGCYDCCQWDTKAEAIAHNQNYINIAINSGIVATCMQGVIIEDNVKYPIDYLDLQKRLEENISNKAFLLNITPLPTRLPTQPLTSQPSQLTYYYYVIKSNGGQVPTSVILDLNQDGRIDFQDRNIIISSIK